MDVPRFAIVDRLTPEQRRKAAAETYHARPGRACLNAADQCPLAVALGLTGAVSARDVADTLLPHESRDAIATGWHTKLYHEICAEANRFMGWVDQRGPNPDKTEAVRAVMLAGLEDE